MIKLFKFIAVGLLACAHLLCLAKSPDKTGQIKSNLYIRSNDGTTTLVDGDFTQYNSLYSDTIDGLDAKKISSFNENIGMIRGSTILAVERRHTIEITDTIFYKIWNLVEQREYQLEFIPGNLSQPGMTGYIEDSYLHTSTPINMDSTSYVNFSINADTASLDKYRFRLIFVTASGGALPLTFTSLKAYQHNDAIIVGWNTVSENNMKDYAVERSNDGRNFKELATIKADNLSVNNYEYTDAFPIIGSNYYRISGINTNGDRKYSETIKVAIEKGFLLMKIFPNPLINKTINLQLDNEPAGQYIIQLINNSGQLIFSKQIQYQGGGNPITITPMQNIPHGIYRLQITRPGAIKNCLSVVY